MDADNQDGGQFAAPVTTTEAEFRVISPAPLASIKDIDTILADPARRDLAPMFRIWWTGHPDKVLSMIATELWEAGPRAHPERSRQPLPEPWASYFAQQRMPVRYWAGATCRVQRSRQPGMWDVNLASSLFRVATPRKKTLLLLGNLTRRRADEVRRQGLNPVPEQSITIPVDDAVRKYLGATFSRSSHLFVFPSHEQRGDGVLAITDLKISD